LDNPHKYPLDFWGVVEIPPYKKGGGGLYNIMKGWWYIPP